MGWKKPVIHRGLDFHNFHREEHEGGVGGFWVVRSLGGMKARGVPV
jgi:hypothetical protein